MTDRSESDEGDILPPPSVDLNRFLEDMSHLFVIMGVFAALAVYLTNISRGNITNSELGYRAGFLGSLAIAFLMLLMVFSELKQRAGGEVIDLLMAHARISENWELPVFSLGILFLFYSLFTIAFTVKLALYYFLGFVVGLVVLAFGFTITAIGMKIINSWTVKKQTIATLSVGILLSTVSVVLLPIWHSYSQFLDISKFEMQTLWMPLLDGLFAGIFVIGVVGFMLILVGLGGFFELLKMYLGDKIEWW